MVRWDDRDGQGGRVASGAYLYRLEMPQAQLGQARTMILMR